MSKVIISSDVPPWLVDAFERIDYGQLTRIVYNVFLTQLRNFCARYPQKTSNYVAHVHERDVPQDVMDILNRVDYMAIPHADLTAMRTAIPKYLNENLSWALKG